MGIKNSQGEQLCYVTVNSREESFVSPIVKTWESAKCTVETMCENIDNENWMRKCIKLEIREDIKHIEAIVLCNHKGWGDDFVKYIKVGPLYNCNI